VNFLISIVIYLVLLISGYIFLFRPITMLRLMYRWPRFIYSKVFDEKQISPKVREALRLIDEDVSLYKDRFPIPIIATRITGMVLLVIFLLGLCMLLN